MTDTTTAPIDSITLTTEEGHEVTLSLADYEVLRRWPFLDITRLVVVGDDAVHGYLSDGTIHPSSLETLLSLHAAPLPVPTPRKPRKRKPTKADAFNALAMGEVAVDAPPKPLSVPRGGCPVVYIRGVKHVLWETMVVGGKVKVPLRRGDSRDVVAWASVSSATMDALRYSPEYPHTLLWSLDDQGRVCCTTRLDRHSPKPVAVYLARMGMDAGAVVVEPLAPVGV